MQKRDGKMIKFVCDACKKDIETGKQQKLILRHDFDKVIVWDICPNCNPTLIQLYGEGKIVDYGMPMLFNRAKPKLPFHTQTPKPGT